MFGCMVQQDGEPVFGCMVQQDGDPVFGCMVQQNGEPVWLYGTSKMLSLCLAVWYSKVVSLVWLYGTASC